jgi:hypothetical protein
MAGVAVRKELFEFTCDAINLNEEGRPGRRLELLWQLLAAMRSERGKVAQAGTRRPLKQMHDRQELRAGLCWRSALAATAASSGCMVSRKQSVLRPRHVTAVAFGIAKALPEN